MAVPLAANAARNYAGRMLRLLPLLLLATPAAAQSVPAQVTNQLPAGYTVMQSATAAFDGHAFVLVALARPDEKTDPAPARPFLIYERGGQGYALVARNDDVVLRADEGGQCDPFEDGGITAKGRYFTVENSVACGQHWTWFITFRFDPALKTYVFDNSRAESWYPNPSTKPDADALVSDGGYLTRAHGKPVRFSDWRDPKN